MCTLLRCNQVHPRKYREKAYLTGFHTEEMGCTTVVCVVREVSKGFISRALLWDKAF